MISSFLFLSILAIDPSATATNFRDVLNELPKKGDLLVGSSEGEHPFSFEFNLGDPVEPEPKIHGSETQLTWTDSFLLKEGSYMQVGEKKIEFGCALVLGTSLSDKNYLVEMFLYPTHARCKTAGADQANPNWLRFTYNTSKPNRVLGPEFSHLYNKFNAVYSTSPQP